MTHATTATRFAAACAALLLAACATAPAPTTPEVAAEALPATTRIPDTWSPEAADSGHVDDGWIESFGDRQLEDLVAEALANNPNLRAAAAQVERAAGLARVAGSALKPAVSLAGDVAEIGGDDAVSGTSYSAGISISWEADVWGRVRAEAAAGEETLAASVADYEAARQSLAAATAKSWFLATESRMQLDLAEETVEIYGPLYPAVLLASQVLGFVMSAPASGAGVDDRVGSLNREAYLAFQRKDFRRAEELAGRAWQLAEAEGDRLEAGLAAANTAAVLAIHRRMDDALAWYEKAQVRLQEAGRARQRGRLAAARGAVLYLKQDAELGDLELQRAATLLGEDDWRLQFLATALRLWSDLDVGPAFGDFHRLAERARQSGDPGRVAPALMALGWIEAAGGGEYAVELYREAIGLFEERGDAASVALANRNIGVAYLRADDLARARAELGKALEEARRAGDVRLEFVALNDLGIAYAQAGESGRALMADREAEEVIARLADDLRQHRRADTLLVDFYHLLRMRYLTLPALLLDPFPYILDQLAVEPEGEERGGKR